MKLWTGESARPGYSSIAGDQELVEAAVAVSDDIEEQVRSSSPRPPEEPSVAVNAERSREPAEDSEGWLEVSAECAVVHEGDEHHWEGAVVSSEGGQSELVTSSSGRAALFDRGAHVRLPWGEQKVKLRIKTAETSLSAEVDVRASTGAEWAVAVDEASGVVAGTIRLSWRRVVHGADEAMLCADRLVAHFGGDKGHLDVDDVRALVKAAGALGGNLMALGGFERGGLIAACVSVPDEDLFAYVLHRHCILRVCYPPDTGYASFSTWRSRTVLVFVSLLWSFAANCIVSAVVMPDADRVYQLIVITFVDTFGVGVLSVLFYVGHSPCILAACALCYRLNVPAIVTTVFSFALVVFLLGSLTHAELLLAAYSFFPIYGTARVTEIFKLGTYWAMQVQLGGFPA